MRVAEPLTDKKIKAAKPRIKPYMLMDGGGLYLEITPTGSKLWRLKYRIADKDNRMSLGRYPDMSLKDARDKRSELRKLIDSGIDPLAERKKVKAEALAHEAELKNTFEHVAREWHEKNRERWTLKYAETIIHRLEKYIFPHIGNIPISKIELPDYIKVIKILENRGTYDLAKRIAQICQQVTTYAMTIGVLKNNYASGVVKTVKKVPVTHLAAITDPDKLGRLLIDIDHYHGEFSTCFALKLIPLVFLRNSELRLARWSEIDLDAAIWIVPAGRMKRRRDHLVPLARQAIEIFKAIKPYSGNYDLVFPGRLSTKQPITDNALLTALRRLGYDKNETCIHGFRTSASTLLNERGYNPDAIEMQLSHKLKDSVRAAYNRAQYLSERQRMMQDWADYLDGLRKRANSNVSWQI